MLKRILIQNYRSCLRTSLDLETPLSVLIGANGSGKTNILQAVMFLNKLTAQDRYIFKTDAVTVSPRLTALFDLKRSMAQLRASVDAYTDEANNDVILGSTEKWLITDRRGHKFNSDIPFGLLRRPSGHHIIAMTGSRIRARKVLFGRSRGKYVEREVPKEKLVMESLNSAFDFCAGIKYYGASQFTNPGSCPVSFELEQDSEHSRPFRLRGHARILYDMYSANENAASSNFHQFVDIVGRRGLKLIDDIKFRKVETSSFDYSVRVGGKVVRRRKHKVLVIPQFTIGKQRLSPNQLSEGSFKTLALLFHVITASSTGMLIEEPEVCVHQGLLSSILELIKTYSEQKLIIISTHSDFVLDHVLPENVHRVAYDKTSGTSVHNIRKTMTKKEYMALRTYLRQDGNLGEYWREGGLGDRS